ncbi:MAG: hypothetical protein GF411_20435 [Candidatus Lokiarchaeota archaeon]|nr:hypothetical protein [Candidatus Lokiarchaeota archaeon]
MELDLTNLALVQNLQKIVFHGNRVLEELDLTPIAKCKTLQSIEFYDVGSINKLNLIPLESCKELRKIVVVSFREITELCVFSAVGTVAKRNKVAKNIDLWKQLGL